MRLVTWPVAEDYQGNRCLVRCCSCESERLELQPSRTLTQRTEVQLDTSPNLPPHGRDLALVPLELLDDFVLVEAPNLCGQIRRSLRVTPRRKSDSGIIMDHSRDITPNDTRPLPGAHLDQRIVRARGKPLAVGAPAHCIYVALRKPDKRRKSATSGGLQKPKRETKYEPRRVEYIWATARRELIALIALIALLARITL